MGQSLHKQPRVALQRHFLINKVTVGTWGYPKKKKKRERKKLQLAKITLRKMAIPLLKTC